MSGAEILYRKVGRRYKPVGSTYNTVMTGGIWLVENARPEFAHAARICRIGDLPDPMPLAAIERHRECAAQALLRLRDAHSLNQYLVDDLLDAVFLAIARAEQAGTEQPSKEESDG